MDRAVFKKYKIQLNFISITYNNEINSIEQRIFTHKIYK